MDQTQNPARITLSILIPVRNEGVNLRIILKMLRGVVEASHEVLVVYDQIDDDSIPVVSAMQGEYPNLRAIHNAHGRGPINALRAGVEAARGDYVLIFAADEAGPLLAIEDMLALMNQGCEFVSCTRYAYGGRRLGGSMIGHGLSRLANRLFRWIAGAALTDSTTGIRMFRRSVFDRLHLEAKPVGWAVAFEMAMKAQLLGLMLGEVPIISIDRLYGGKSTFRVGPWTVEYLRWFVWGALHLRRASNGRRPVVARLPSVAAR